MLESSNFKIIIILAFIIFFLIIWLVLTLHNIQFKKRINNYVISKNINEDISILGKLEKVYFKLRKKMAKFLKNFIKKKNKTNTEIEDNLMFNCDKILLSIITLFIYLIITIINSTKPKSLFIICSMIVGYLIPTIKKIIDYKINRKKIEKDLLKVISLINSNLQSGKSIMQAIKSVAKELDGPISLEFKKIEKDLENGLSLSRAFTRFKNRVKLEEVDYITVSLLILNETGGDISSIFKLLEESFYTRRKLDSELKATIASSKLIFQILVALPFFIYLLIGFVNPTYFTIFFNSSLGIILFSIIILIYLLYIIVIKNIMKVEKY